MTIDYSKLLATPLEDNDSNENTVSAYLGAQLSALWLDDESFSGKRPFGNSGWKSDLAPALIKAGFLEGVIEDEEDDCWDFDSDELETLVQNAISHLCGNSVRSYS